MMASYTMVRNLEFVCGKTTKEEMLGWRFPANHDILSLNLTGVACKEPGFF
jgi:hypothetical protein